MDFPRPPQKAVPYDFVSRGNCHGVDPNDFFPERGDHLRLHTAKAVCAGCEVRNECLEYALSPPIEKFGIWGGLSEHERRSIRTSRLMARKRPA